MKIVMSFYVQRNKDGTVHVQNAIMGRLGQHHVHSKKGFERWKKDVKEVEEMKGDCDCGLEIGDVREYTGEVWHNDRFDKEV